MTEPAADASTDLQGILFILSGPSGVGKDTVLRHALPRLGKIRTSISVTTRHPRRGEQDGIDYFFVTAEEFIRRLDAGDFLEHADIVGNMYGTPRSWVLEQLRAGTDVVLEIDVQGALQVKSAFPQAILIFLAPPNWQELARRLRSRKTEDEATVRRRLEKACHELAHIDQYEYLIINDRLADATDRLVAVVTAERCRPFRQDIRALLAGGVIDG